MFINTQDTEKKEYYERMLKAAGSLSNLFSESSEPYLGYRLVENLFCRSFDAENLSRKDNSIDASKGSVGIGVKTFKYRNGKSFEKIAEFNSRLDMFNSLDDREKVLKIAEFRNERIRFAKTNYRLRDMIYHCVARTAGKIVVYETPMEPINIENISGIKTNRNTIRFADGANLYGFSLSKSTLFRQFEAESPLMEFPVKIITDPFEALEKMFRESFRDLAVSSGSIPYVVLPLYSVNHDNKYVAEKSSANQWNAGGRPRDLSEVYIQVPALVHRKAPGFFPDRETKFSLQLPNGNRIRAKICQAGGKALMSDPNEELGKWLLRDVLNLKEGELLTYEKLESLGLDSVIVSKNGAGDYSIDFGKMGSYDAFAQKPETVLSEIEV